jgi:hypothetical protein
LLITAIAIFFSVTTIAVRDEWFAGDPPLVTGLSNHIETAREEFRARIAGRFPVGSSEEILVQELAQQGFKPKWGRSGSSTASYERASIVCRHVWDVTWRADKLGRLEHVDGMYRPICL